MKKHFSKLKGSLIAPYFLLLVCYLYVCFLQSLEIA
nr:MAG TPA: hypothetical protein [Caudoviricetes sp.]